MAAPTRMRAIKVIAMLALLLAVLCPETHALAGQKQMSPRTRFTPSRGAAARARSKIVAMAEPPEEQSNEPPAEPAKLDLNAEYAQFMEREKARLSAESAVDSFKRAADETIEQLGSTVGKTGGRQDLLDPSQWNLTVVVLLGVVVLACLSQLNVGNPDVGIQNTPGAYIR